MTSESIGLQIWSHRLEILIDFISRDEYSSLEAFSLADDFEYIHCSHDIRLESPYRISITLSHKWLRREMKYYFWFIFITYPL